MRKSQSGEIPGQSGEVPEFARTEDKILDACSKLVSRNQNFEQINDLALRRDAARTGMKAISLFFRRHDIQDNYMQHNDTQHNGLICDTQRK